MGSKERIQQLKENTRSNILEAALRIVKEDGWAALSMRKIADEISYTAPIIYEYFANKESLVAELSNTGYRLLSLRIREAKESKSTPAEQLEVMWLAYWKFAFAEKELYQTMFGVDVNCCMKEESSGAVDYGNLFFEVIRNLMAGQNPTEDTICTKYYTFWSVVHGLISINLVNKGRSDEINQIVLNDAIRGIIRSLEG